MSDSVKLLAVLDSSDQKVVRACESNGVLEMFKKALLSINERPPKDMLSYFVQFLAEKERRNLSMEHHRKFQGRFGNAVMYYQARGIVMVMLGETPCYFAPAKALKGPAQKASASSICRTTGGAYAPRDCKLFSAALTGQVAPNRYSVPRGQIRRSAN